MQTRLSTRLILFTAVALACTQPPAALAAAASFQMADLRSFFHGDPPPVPKAPAPKVLASVSRDSGVAADPQIEAFFRALAAAVKARDGEPMLARLADKYAVDDAPSGRPASAFFQQAMERMSGPSAIVIKSIESQPTQRLVRAEFLYEAQPAKARVFRFDPAGKLLWSDLFRLQVQAQ